MPQLGLSALVPGFCEPTSPPVNPLAERAEDEVVAWLWRTGFLTNEAQEEHLRSFRFGLYHGIATPELGLPALVLGMKWFCWGSLADDQYDNYDCGDREERVRSVIQAARTILGGGAVLGGDPVVRGLAEFWPALVANMSPAARRRVTRNFLDYLEAVRFQNRFHAKGEVPDAATFLGLRRHTIAMIFQADVLEALSCLDIPGSLRGHRMFRELVWCFADVTAWHNDVYGLEKDIADGQLCNAVLVTSASEDCSTEVAVDRVVERAKERQRLFLRIEEELPSLADELGLGPPAAASALALTRQLRAYTYANLVWIGQTRRYDLDLPRIRGTFDDVLCDG
ncbi:terpene synthase family protein [Allokutzneria sp. A3M-2-11 16]|uniref:terpene synthase family protein n=1 Tax=Allokutzneria sp. A3M-2-11 16 TaxID=2962043 RepID=UPI0020B7E0E2|nr:terpene synthase family protein [Allokutzneria sp. A3M-2-11 16]MCP3800815.1 terpene synthase family protein [Allokutzneria sp. A3M-2-11 16]